MSSKIKKAYRNILRTWLTRKNRRRLENKNFTIISANCVGGVIYHDLGMKFNSPTINMYFSASDFVKLASNLRHYLECDLVEIESNYDYPCARCDDIILHLVHYKSFKEAQLKWKERVKRVNYNNLYFIMVDRDGCDTKDIINFDNICQKHKLEFPGIVYNYASSSCLFR